MLIEFPALGGGYVWVNPYRVDIVHKADQTKNKGPATIIWVAGVETRVAVPAPQVVAEILEATG